MNFFDTAERLVSGSAVKVRLDAERCLRVLDRFSTCSICADVCPENAIQPGQPPVLDAEVCKGCLACVAHCPSGACQAVDNVRELYNCVSHVDAPVLELVCAFHTAPKLGRDSHASAVQMKGCLVCLGAGVYTGLKALGFSEVLLRTDACSTCRWHTLRDSIQEQVERVRDVLACWSDPMEITCIDHIENPLERVLLQTGLPPLTRRDLLRAAVQTPEAALVQRLTPAAAHEDRMVNPDRLRLIAAVAHLPQPEFPGRLVRSGPGLAVPEVRDSCLACGTCVRSCPAGVLQLDIDEEKTGFVLYADPRLCTGCEICVHVCAPAAMTVNHSPSFEQVFPSELVELQKGELMECKRCGTHVVRRDDVQLCPLCQAREKNPFHFSLPPGFENIIPSAAADGVRQSSGRSRPLPETGE